MGNMPVRCRPERRHLRRSGCRFCTWCLPCSYSQSKCYISPKEVPPPLLPDHRQQPLQGLIHLLFWPERMRVRFPQGHAGDLFPWVELFRLWQEDSGATLALGSWRRRPSTPPSRSERDCFLCSRTLQKLAREREI